MNRLLLLAVILSFTRLAYTQSLSPEVISSSGAHFSSAGTQLSWTIGEPIIDSYAAGANKLTQGFHQTFLTVTSVSEYAPDIAIKTFPNPSSDAVFIQIDAPSSDFRLELFDVLGRSLQKFQASNTSLIELDISEYAAGNYLLRISNTDNAPLKTFKIQKIK